MKIQRMKLLRRKFALLLVGLLGFFQMCPVQAAAENNRFFVDFDYIRQIAPDAVAWLYQPNQPINAPVLFSKDEEYYLRRRYDEIADPLGSLFFTGDAPPDFSEQVWVIHGLNSLTGELFGTLNQYREEDYYQQNPTLYFYTPKGDYQLDVFAGIRTSMQYDNWLVSSDIDLLTESLPEILDRSFLTPLPDTLPEADDKWVILTAESKKDDGARYVLFSRCRPMAYQGDETAIELTQMEMDSRETLNGWYTLDGFGTWMIYGQNDPAWNRLIFEAETSTKERPFGDGGCGPTALALAIANLLEPEELCKINDYALHSYGFTFCHCSITQSHCIHAHLPYQVNTPEEMLRYFPLVIASFATGNNTLGVQGRQEGFGSNMNYLKALCEQVYGLTVEETADKETAFAFLQEGKGMAVTCTGYTLFSRNTHYITLAGADDTYLYVLDPLRREDYGNLDRNGKLEIITPGLVRLERSKAADLMMHPIYLLSAPTENAE